MTSIREIQSAVCEQYQISRDEMLGRSRKARIVFARHAAMQIARQSGASFPKIGREFARDHATVVHACKKVLHA